MPQIRNARHPGPLPTYGRTEPVPSSAGDRPVRIELLEFCVDRGVGKREFERAVGYPDLFRRLEEGLRPGDVTLAKFRRVMREWRA